MDKVSVVIVAAGTYPGGAVVGVTVSVYAV